MADFSDKKILFDPDDNPFVKFLQYIEEPSEKVKKFYQSLEDEVLPSMITVEKLDSDFPNGFHFDSVDDIEIGTLLIVYDKKETEVVRVRAISTLESEKFLLFDRGYGDTQVSEIAVGDQLIVIGWQEPTDLYPLTEMKIIKKR